MDRYYEDQEVCPRRCGGILEATNETVDGVGYRVLRCTGCDYERREERVGYPDLRGTATQWT